MRRIDGQGVFTLNDRKSIPEGFEPIESANLFGGRNGPIYEKILPDGGWVRGFLVEEKHCNKANIVHGGMLMTFADITLSRAVLEVAEPPFVTLRMGCDFVSPAFIGNWVEGRARVTKRGRQIIFLEGQITSRGKTVMSVTSQFKLLRSRPRNG
jgi:uncharacterized protein (TIGR00369 family)